MRTDATMATDPGPPPGGGVASCVKGECHGTLIRESHENCLRLVRRVSGCYPDGSMLVFSPDPGHSQLQTGFSRHGLERVCGHKPSQSNPI